MPRWLWNTSELPSRNNNRVSNGSRWFPILIPGDPTGIPGTVSPSALGFCMSSNRTSLEGTCPSTMYLLTNAVWQEKNFWVNPTRFFKFNNTRSLRFSVSDVKPASCMCVTQASQHPHVCNLNTISLGLCAKTVRGKIGKLMAPNMKHLRFILLVLESYYSNAIIYHMNVCSSPI